MIAMLTGHIVHRNLPEVVLDVNGVGYELQISMQCAYALPEQSEAKTTLFVHMIVREDAQTLYGFVDQAERHLFRLLLKVNGIGPKMALAIVSNMTVGEFFQRVQSDDVAGLNRIPGVGQKTAGRIVMEMKDQLKKWQNEMNKPEGMTILNALVVDHKDHSVSAIDALMALGYKEKSAQSMVAPFIDQGLSVEALIREALKSSIS